MRISGRNVGQDANGDWFTYRYFGGNRFRYHKTVYEFEKKKVAKEKELLITQAKRKGNHMHVRVIKCAEGWTIWYRELTGRFGRKG